MVDIKIFIDSSKLNEIKKANDYGLLDGVTTNPSLIKAAVEEEKAKGGDIDIEDYIKKILSVARGLPVSLEVIGTDSDSMIEEGRKLYKTFFILISGNKVAAPFYAYELGEGCIGCSDCSFVCPTGAITMGASGKPVLPQVRIPYAEVGAMMGNEVVSSSKD